MGKANQISDLRSNEMVICLVWRYQSRVSTRVYIDGRVVDRESATISVFDRGFLYGDSVYEVMRTSGGNPLDQEPHLERLKRSADGLVLSIPSLDSIRHAIAKTLDAAGNNESYIRVVVTRGQGEVGLDTALADKSELIIIVKPLAIPPDELYRDGAKVQIVDVVRTSPRSVDPALKSGNYLNNILALAEAKKAGAYEALMCNAKGQVAEGSSSNVFCILKKGVMRTPPIHVGLLAGITRMRIIELARHAGFDVEEGTLTPDEVRGAQEVFITSSIRGVMPVTRVDGTDIGDGQLGPITKRVIALYSAHLARAAQKTSD